jgi:hypothetical protein
MENFNSRNAIVQKVHSKIPNYPITFLEDLWILMETFSKLDGLNSSYLAKNMRIAGRVVSWNIEYHRALLEMENMSGQLDALWNYKTFPNKGYLWVDTTLIENNNGLEMGQLVQLCGELNLLEEKVR